MAERVFNFSPGPCTLPLEIMETAAADYVNYKGTGLGVAEMSHRSKEFTDILNQCTADLRELMQIPDNYKVLYMQGGATLQNACIPLNLCSGAGSFGNYITTGFWSQRTIDEARKWSNPHEAYTSAKEFTHFPTVDQLNINPEGSYVHFCYNETVNAVEQPLTPELLAAFGDQPIICDMSSCILSMPVDVSKYGVIYAGAQKNAGPAGTTIVIVRDDLLGNPRPDCPNMCDWTLMAETNSLYNTPPCFGIYKMSLYFDYVKRNGGVQAFYEKSQEKSSVIYAAIDNSNGFYTSPVVERNRSRMNILFYVREGTPEFEEMFCAEAKALGMIELKGHASTGGIRASIYNGMPVEGAHKLAGFMKDFQEKYESSSKL